MPCFTPIWTRTRTFESGFPWSNWTNMSDLVSFKTQYLLNDILRLLVTRPTERNVLECKGHEQEFGFPSKTWQRNIKVCCRPVEVIGCCWTMRRICRLNPISYMKSASSSTRYLTRSRLILPWIIISAKRSAAATKILRPWQLPHWSRVINRTVDRTGTYLG